MAKDLGQELENMEEGIENLKNKEFRILGFKVTFMSVSALAAVLGTVLGGLYFAFTMYQKIEEVAGLDVGAFEQRMEVIETQLDEALGYARDIKNDLREDVQIMENTADRMEDKVEASEDRIKEAQRQIDTLLEEVLADMNQLSKDVTASIREVESVIRESEKDVRDTMRETESRIDADMRQLDKDIHEKLQEALDNPLNDG